MNFRSYFHFKWIPERERERERERESESAKGRSTHAPVRALCMHQAPVRAVRKHQRYRSRSEIAISPSLQSRSTRCFARSRLTLRLREIAPSIAISALRRSWDCEALIAISQSGAVLREIAIDGAIVGLELAKHCAVEPSRVSSVNLGFFCVFLGLSFPCSIFQTLENIFRKIFWNTTKHMKTFSLQENSISGKWNIFWKCFYTNQTQPKYRVTNC